MHLLSSGDLKQADGCRKGSNTSMFASSAAVQADWMGITIAVSGVSVNRPVMMGFACNVLNLVQFQCCCLSLKLHVPGRSIMEHRQSVAQKTHLQNAFDCGHAQQHCRQRVLQRVSHLHTENSKHLVAVAAHSARVSLEWH